MELLPIELQRLVLAQLTALEIARIGLTCSHWSNYVWKVPLRLRIEHGNQIRGLFGLPVRLRRYQGIIDPAEERVNAKERMNTLKQRQGGFIHASVTDLDLSWSTLSRDSLSLLQHLTQIERLDLSGAITYMLPVEVFRCVGNFPNLTHLDLSYCLSINYNEFEVLANLTKLVSLNLSNISAGINLEAIGLVTSLQELDLVGINALDSWSLACLSSLTLLESLRFEGSRHLIGNHGYALDDTGIVGLSTLGQLTSLEIYHCPAITDTGLSSIAKSHTKLKRLQLMNCTGFTQVGLTEVVQCLTNLEELEIPYSVQLSSQAIAEMLPLLSGTLRKLDLSSHKKLTYDALETASSLQSLQELNLSACPLLDDEALRIVVTAMPRLRRVDVSACTSISDEAITKYKASFASSSPRLRLEPTIDVVRGWS